jgi:hypothetical protein
VKHTLVYKVCFGGSTLSKKGPLLGRKNYVQMDFKKILRQNAHFFSTVGLFFAEDVHKIGVILDNKRRQGDGIRRS